MSKLPRLIGFATLGLVAILGTGLVSLKAVYGGGTPYPDISTTPVRPADTLRPLLELDLPPGNITSSSEGRIFFNYHPFAHPTRFSSAVMFELVNGTPHPYPSAEFQSRYQGPLGLTVDGQDRLWIVEPAGLENDATRILGFDLTTNELIFEHSLESGVGFFAQDLRVSPDGRTLFLADTGLFAFTSAAILVLDLQTKELVRTWSGHPTLSPQDWVIRTAEGPYRLAYGLITFSVGVDGLAVSPDGDWVYYATMSHDTLYRVRLESLRDSSLSNAELEPHIEAIGRKPLSDGIEMDTAGRVLVTDVENGGLALLNPSTQGGDLRTWVRGDRVVWADAVNVLNDGTVLFTDSSIPAYIQPLASPPPRAALDAAGPFTIYSVDPEPLAPVDEN